MIWKRVVILITVSAVMSCTISLVQSISPVVARMNQMSLSPKNLFLSNIMSKTYCETEREILAVHLDEKFTDFESVLWNTRFLFFAGRALANS